MPPSGQQLGLGLGLSTSTTPSNKLLDQFGGAAAAYSLQDLSRVGGTNVVRARRSTDDAEQDFTAGGVSGGVLRNFALNNDADLIRFANQATAADKRMYFDGVNDAVSVSGMTATSNYFGACTIEATIYVEDPSRTSTIFGLGQSYNLAHTGGVWYFALSTNTGVTVTSGIQTVAADFNASGQATALRINGVTVWTGTSATSSSSTFFYIGATGGSICHKGLIYDFSLSGSSVKNFSFNGYGNTNADWEDQVGSNDGTVVGSPALFSGQGFDAYVTTLYDQSGNGRDATQATAASQPQIVADGVVVTDANGNPAMDFDGSDDFFDCTDFLTGTSVSTFTKANHPLELALQGTIWSHYQYLASQRSLLFALAGNVSGDPYRILRSPDGNSVVSSTGGTQNTNENIYSVFAINGGGAFAWRNGTSIISDATASGIRNSNESFVIGASDGGASLYAEMQLSEMIVYADDKLSDRTAIESNVASRYGITLA